MDTIFITLLVYLIGIFLLSWYFSRRESLSAYFVNARSTGLWMLTFANVATIVGAGAVVPIIAEIYRTGISYGLALPASFIAGMIILAFVAKQMKIMGDRYNAHTLVDFFEARFGSKNKILSSIIQTLLLIIWTAVQAIAIASLASVLIGIDYYLALILTALVTIVYTAVGGLKIDIITDFIQFWFILIVFVLMTILSWQNVGGLGSLIQALPTEHLNPFAFGGVGWLVGIVVMSGFLYLGNSVHWQRIFSAKSPQVARRSFWLSLPFIVLFSCIILFLGLVSVVTLSDVPAETAVFELMKTTLSPFVAGLGFAAMLAVIMSSIDSLLIGGSTVLYRALFRDIKENQGQLVRARILTASFGVVGFLLAFFVPNIVTVSLLVSYLALVFVPPVFAGLYGSKVSGDAVFYALLISSIALIVLYPIVGPNVFFISTLLSVLITFLYDKLKVFLVR